MIAPSENPASNYQYNIEKAEIQGLFALKTMKSQRNIEPYERKGAVR
jgi:hypothetical protein